MDEKMKRSLLKRTIAGSIINTQLALICRKMQIASQAYIDKNKIK